MCKPEMGLDPDYRSRLGLDSAIFFWTPIRSKKFVKKPDPESLFHFGSSWSLYGHFLVKNMGKL